MEDDWASPWADADDRSSTGAIRNLDVKDTKAAGRAGIDVPQARTPNSSVAVHTNDLWSSGEHGFGDASAWASSSPAVGSGGIPGVVGGSGLLGWVGPGSPFVAKRTAEEKTEPPGAPGDEQLEANKKEEWFGDTDEADAWAAGSYWGDAKTVETSDLNVNTRVSSEVAHEIKSPPGVNALTEGANKDGLAHTEGHNEDQPIDAEVLDNKPIESRFETSTGEIVSAGQASPIPKTASVEDLVTKHESGLEGKTEIIEAEIKVADDEDEFGDFADEEYFGDAEEILPKDIAAFVEELLPLPQIPSLKVDIPFNIDTSLLNKLYPILTSYPEPPPLEEIIHTTDSRKAWYRLSQTGTIRKDRSGDDNYVRVTWGGSKIQKDVNKIVARWMAEDRSTGGGVALGGSRRLGAMFGWGEGVEKKAPPAQLNLSKDNRSRQNSLGFGAASKQLGVTKSPFGTSTTTHPAENGTVPSPQTASFGWSSSDNSQPTVESHPGPSPNSVKSDERLPSTPCRASFQGTSSRMSSQPVTPSRSVVSHSSITSSHSSKLSHNLAATRPSSPSPQSIQRTAEVIATTPIISAPMDSPLSSTPVAPTSVGQLESTTVSVPYSNFDEWRAFENITTTVKLPSTTEANCNFDEWGAFGGLTEPMDSKPADSISGQGQISALLQPPEAEEQAICSNKDEWSAFAGPLPTPRTPTSDGLSEKLPAPTMKPGEQAGSKGQKINGWGSLATAIDSLTPKPPVLEQPLVQPPAYALTESGLKSLGGLGLGTHKSDGWGSFDAFESLLTPKLPVSALTSTHASEEPSRRSVEAPSPKAHNTGNWDSFEALEFALAPKPKISNQPLGNLPTYTSQEKTKLAEKATPKAQNIDAWGSFGGFETPQPKATGNPQRPTPIISNSASTKPITSLVPPVLSTPVANDDDDDWGEMVQSPEIPRVNSPFSTVLQPTSLQPTLSHSNTPRTMSPAPFQNMQQQPQTLTPNIPSAASMFDLGSFEELPAPKTAEDTTSRNGSGGNDTWDLSFFEGLAPSTSTPANVSALASSNQANSDLWDTPPQKVTGRRENVREMEESRLVNQVVEGLPDLSYMLQ